MNAMTNRILSVLLITTILLVTLGLQGVALAQRDLPPARGGTTYSLGMPPVYKGRSGMETQSYRPTKGHRLYRRRHA
jgi:hypothetical protein